MPVETFWEMVKRVADEIRDKPTWMKAGIDISPEHFETWPGTRVVEVLEDADE